MKAAQLFMIPCPIVTVEHGENANHTIAPHVISAVHKLQYFVVERARTARRFIKATQHPTAIDQLQIFELDKRNKSNGLSDFLKIMKDGVSIGVLSEAGCPGIADPGNLAVQWAHQHDIQVIPLVGPSSIILALMASGLNGQNFAFVGYLPNKKNELDQRLKQLESIIHKTQQSQIFIETPYKNGFLLETMLKSCSPNTKLCIATDINETSEYIKTHTIKEWSNIEIPDLHKRPCIFILG